MPSGPPPGVPERRSLRSRFRRKLKRIPHPHLPHLSLAEVRVLRLFLLLGVFSILVLYAVFRSTRFQDLMRRNAERWLEARIGRDVRIGRFDLSLVPPAFLVRDVWVANDPRGLPGACFSADEIALRGVPSFAGKRLDLPKLRLIRPRLVFELFEDGSNNLTSILEAIGKEDATGTGVDVRLREAVLQRGTIRFREWDSEIDVLLKDAALGARSVRFSRVTRASLACRRVQFRLEDNRVLDLALGLEATLAPRRIHIDQLRLRSDRITVDGSGGIEDLDAPSVSLALTAATTGEALQELFGLEVPLSGGIAVTGHLAIAPRSGLDVRGRFLIPDGALGPFRMTQAGGEVRVDDDGFLLHLDEAAYAGGQLEALVRLERLKNPPLPVRIDVRGRGVSSERFLADIDLPGTGLMGSADVDTTLTFRDDIEKADGAGSFRLTPLPGVPSAVAGRHALPVGGGGPLLIRRGQITFPGTPFETAGGARIGLSGTLSLGTWIPDWTITAAAPAPEMERLAENLWHAIQGRPLTPPLKLDGTAELTARLTRAFDDPRVEGRLAATDFVFKGVRFGTVEGAFLVDRDVLTMSPFRATDLGGSLTLTGKMAWGGKLGDEYLLDGFVADFDRWPIERPLAFLGFGLPITGTVTGRLPLEGVTPQVVGSVPLVLTEGSLWGQPVERLEGTLAFEKGRLVLSGVTGTVSGGRVSGGGFFRYADDGFGVDARAEGVLLGGVPGVQEALAGLTGTFDGRIEGEGTLDRPSFEARGAIREAALDGSPLGAPGAPLVFRADSARGDLSVSVDAPGAMRLTARVPAEPEGPLEARIAVHSLEPYRPLLGLPEGTRIEGSLEGSLTGRREKGVMVAAEGEVAAAVARVFGKEIALSGKAPFRWDGERLSFERLALSASDIGSDVRAGELVLKGTIETGGARRLDIAVNGSVDAGILKAALPEAEISGQIAAAARVGGTLESPAFDGRLHLMDIDFDPGGTASPFEGITGVVTLTAGHAYLNDTTLHWGGGTIALDGSLGLDGATLTDIRVGARLTRVRSNPFEGFRATVSGDIVLRGRGTIESATGDLTLESGRYDQDVSINLGALLGKLRPTADLPPPPTAFDDVALRVLIRVPAGAIEIRNNVARVRASGELDVRGTFGRPIIYGQITAEEGGRLELRGQRYELLAGRILFSNATRIDPFFDLTARTTVREYQITLDLSGTGTRLATHFTSDPQVSQAQIVSLLLTGELPGQSALGVPTGATPVSQDEDIGGVARDLIAMLVTEQATERTRNFFRLDRLQVDPVFVGSSFDAPKLTVGKSIAKNLTLTYSYKPSVNQEQIIIAEYELSPTSFLQFTRDEQGVYSVDVKFRQRLR